MSGAVYAVGDVQGCYDQLRRLLDCIGFDPDHDRLWLTGDLVNLGSQSLAVLRFVRGLGARAVSVIGNHELNLLAGRYGYQRYRPKDTYADILKAPDCDELLDWLRHRPLLHHDAKLRYTMVHAGLLPQWNLQDATRYAGELEHALRSKRFRKFLKAKRGDKPHRWREDLTGNARLRMIANVFTRIRFCSAGGRLEFECKGPPGTQPAGQLPWYQMPRPRWRGERILFGHWGILGVHRENGAICLDSGCVYGGSLSALRLDRKADAVSIPCRV